VLSGAEMPAASPALYFQGSTLVSGGPGSVFGDGLLCAGGALIRLSVKLNTSGASAYPGSGEPAVSAQGAVMAPGERVYQVLYRDAAAFCSPATFNLTNGSRVRWVP
jgi:hypothetical protein